MLLGRVMQGSFLIPAPRLLLFFHPYGSILLAASHLILTKLEEKLVQLVACDLAGLVLVMDTILLVLFFIIFSDTE